MLHAWSFTHLINIYRIHCFVAAIPCITITTANSDMTAKHGMTAKYGTAAKHEVTANHRMNAKHGMTAKHGMRKRTDQGATLFLVNS